MDARLETEDKMIDLDTRPALVCVPNAAELLGPWRDKKLPNDNEFLVAFRGGDDVEH
jgi:hypothetical protein